MSDAAVKLELAANKAAALLEGAPCLESGSQAVARWTSELQQLFRESGPLLQGKPQDHRAAQAHTRYRECLRALAKAVRTQEQRLQERRKWLLAEQQRSGRKHAWADTISKLF